MRTKSEECVGLLAAGVNHCRRRATLQVYPKWLAKSRLFGIGQQEMVQRRLGPVSRPKKPHCLPKNTPQHAAPISRPRMARFDADSGGNSRVGAASLNRHPGDCKQIREWNPRGYANNSASGSRCGFSSIEMSRKLKPSRGAPAACSSVVYMLPMVRLPDWPQWGYCR